MSAIEFAICGDEDSALVRFRFRRAHTPNLQVRVGSREAVLDRSAVESLIAHLQVVLDDFPKEKP